MDRQWGPAFVTEPAADPEVPEFDEEADERETELADAAAERLGTRDAHADDVDEATRERLLGELSAILENLDGAIAAARESGDAPAVVDGVDLVRRQLDEIRARVRGR